MLFQDAFCKFEEVVTAEDSQEFHSTTLEDVRKAARNIEEQLGARQCLRNMRRIEPLIDGLTRYSKVVEVLCNGTPYLPWIWVRMSRPSLSNDLTANVTGPYKANAPGKYRSSRIVLVLIRHANVNSKL
jgi:hypothetical protein